MPRLPLVSRAAIDDPLVTFMYDRKYPGRDPATQPGQTASGAPGNYEAVLAHSPDVLEHAVRGFYLKQTKKRKLPLRYMELAITRIGWACSCRWMYSEHRKILRGLGYSEQALDDIPAWQTSGQFDRAERAVLAYADCIALDHGRVPDSLFALLQDSFDPGQIVELTYVASMFMMNAGMIRALRLEHDDYDERVREMPSPPDYRFVDAEPAPLPRRD
ncbi:carboxymuconolactone decarboxylase family protein [Pelagerythrobacter aerophilus]|uniref:Carboxymuconolactone decarboxylase family protein n=1 Tax=Pelagerythrobacter aerophilus TaxID=2306995 RepID=A0A418NCR1_9SPHN|nr:carboxymuconolactone decarboxylase family protein [Pelagerythrobacter aerophilus]RIV75561.1 carboxymuconolactone decarboxylase family protein [Pelagerythrobacter aerophilus]